MINIKQTKWNILTLVSLICLMIPFSIYTLWIYVFNLGTTQAERVAVFKNYFPDFLDGRWSSTIVSIIFCITSVILSSLNLKHLNRTWYLMNILIILLSSILLFLNLFSMM